LLIDPPVVTRRVFRSILQQETPLQKKNREKKRRKQHGPLKP